MLAMETEPPAPLQGEEELGERAATTPSSMAAAVMLAALPQAHPLAPAAHGAAAAVVPLALGQGLGLKPMRSGGPLKRAPARSLQLSATEAAPTVAASSSTSATAFVHALDSPRASADQFAPPPVGTWWSWEPDVINADGADAGPNGVKKVVREKNPDYEPTRGHCSVHVERNVQQQKHKIFNGDSDAREKSAGVVNQMLEQLKDFSTTVGNVEPGKRLLASYLEQAGESAAAAYMLQQHLLHKITLAEMNDPSLRRPGQVTRGAWWYGQRRSGACSRHTCRHLAGQWRRASHVERHRAPEPQSEGAHGVEAARRRQLVERRDRRPGAAVHE